MSSKLLKTLVKNIDEKLHDLERRPSWLADKSGISKAMISRILSQTTNPTLDTVEAIAEALGEEPWDMLTVSGLDRFMSKIREMGNQAADKELNLVKLRLERAEMEIEHDLDFEERTSELMELDDHITAEERRIAALKTEISRLFDQVVAAKKEKSILAIQGRLNRLNMTQLQDVLDSIDHIENPIEFEDEETSKSSKSK